MHHHLSSRTSQFGAAGEAIFLGVLGGILHHLLFQYPSQAGVFTVIYAFVTANFLYLLVSNLGSFDPEQSVLLFLGNLALFNCCYVLSILKLTY